MTILQHLILSAFVLTGRPALPVMDSTESPAPVSVDIPAFVDRTKPVEFSVTVELPHPCYELKPAAVRVDRDRNVVLFHTTAVESATDCEAITSFKTARINLGRLPEGTFEVRELKNLKKWGEFSVQTFAVSAQSLTPLEAK